MYGYNDDLVMPWSVGLFLRDTALRFRQTAYELTYASLNNFSKANQGYQVYKGESSFTDNPWQMQAGNETTDLTWLI
jgi:nucleoid-associated protein YejK